MPEETNLASSALSAARCAETVISRSTEMANSSVGEIPIVRSNRILSIDALRGFDMFFITGGSVLVSGLCAVFGCGDGWIASQMHHVNWVGFSHHDTIFPLFLFLAGVSWPFSLSSQRAKGASSMKLHGKIVIRAAALFLIGLSFGGVLQFKPDFRLMSVLGFIGLSWGIAALVYLHAKRRLFRWLVFALLLVGQFALLHFCVAPDAADGASSYSQGGNIPMWIDRILWPTHMLACGFEPESLFSLQGGIAIALAGMFAGDVLRCLTSSPQCKMVTLLMVSLVSAVCAVLLACVLNVPIIKKLWTPSFVSASLAYSFILLAFFYWIIDDKGWHRWTIVFRPVGRNSILAYMLVMTGTATAMHKYLFGGLCGNVGNWGMAVKGLTLYAVTWGILYYLEKKNVFLKV